MRATVHGCVGALLPLLAACATTSPGGGMDGIEGGAGGAVSSAAAVPKPDAAFDWHELVLLPFGAPLTDSPKALHEVLLFHEAAQGATGTVNSECYSVDAPPRFIDGRLRDYLLCFEHDRLNRIDASVLLPAAAAAETFARACALWQRSAVPAPDSAGRCAGKEGGIAFSARLDRGPGESSILSMTLSSAAPDGFPGS